MGDERTTYEPNDERNIFRDTDHLSLDQLQAYLKGKYSGSNLRSIEEHLVDCPLCNEALEGLDLIDTPSSMKGIVADLNDSVAERAGTLEKRTEGPDMGMIMRIAAVLVVMAGAFWMVNWILEGDDAVMTDNMEAVETEERSDERELDPMAETIHNAINSDADLAEDEALEEIPAPSEYTYEADKPAKERDTYKKKAIELADVVEEEMESSDDDADFEGNNDVDISADAPVEDAEFLSKNYTGAESKRAASATSAATVEELNAISLPETPATYPGGQPAMLRFINKELRYPPSAREQGITGTSVITFTVSRSGRISNVKVARSAHPLLDLEATRVVKNMPKWEPARSGDKKISSTVTQPITFRL